MIWRREGGDFVVGKREDRILLIVWGCFVVHKNFHKNFLDCNFFLFFFAFC